MVICQRGCVPTIRRYNDLLYTICTNKQGRINKCGGPVRKNVWRPPSPPPMPSSRDYVFNFIIKYRIDKDLDSKLDF